MSDRPLLSLILCSRNDSYMGNSRWRLETSINLALKNAIKAKFLDNLEVIVCDWGSKIPLSKALHLIPEAVEKVKFVYIPPELAKVKQRDSKFPEVIALNAAARRANGEYIGRIDNDTVVGNDFFKKFEKLNKNNPSSNFDLSNAFLFVERKSVQFRISRLSLNLNQINSFIECFKNHFQVESATNWGKEFWWSPVGIMLFHRDIWNNTKGYDEKLIYWGWMEGDLALRLEKKHDIVEFSKYVGHHFYHLEHYPSLTAYKDRNGPATPRKKNEPVFENLSYSVNDEDWGLWSSNEVLIQNYKLIKKNDWLFFLINKIFFIPMVLNGLFLRKIDQIRMHGVSYIKEKWNRMRIFIGDKKNCILKIIVS